jgi:alkylation response protein AidB-like acyl-CoA dehydrogenase
VVTAATGTSRPAELENPLPPDSWKKVVDAGITGLRVPDDIDGNAASGVEVAIVAESAGRNLCRLPILTSAILATELLVMADAGEAVLRGLNAGQQRAAIVVHRSLGSLSCPSAGETPFAWDSADADVAVAVDADGNVYLCDLAEDQPCADLTRQLRRVGSVKQKVGTVGAHARKKWQALALAAVTADLVGTMAGSLDVAVDYLKTRQQFGKVIGSFQGLQHLVAQAKVSVEASRSAMWYAAWAVDKRDVDTALMASRVAKAYASGAARDVCELTIQLHGGIGMTWEAIPHIFLRRALLDRAIFGDEHHQLAEIADIRLGARKAAV